MRPQLVTRLNSFSRASTAALLTQHGTGYTFALTHSIFIKPDVGAERVRFVELLVIEGYSNFVKDSGGGCLKFRHLQLEAARQFV